MTSGDLQSVRDLVASAEALIDIGRAERAASIVRQGLARTPDDARLLASLVRALLAGGHRAEALETAQLLAATAPNSWITLVWLSRAHRFTSWNPRAVARHALPAAERAVEIAPSRSATHHELGLALLDSTSTLSRWGDSRARLERARESALRAIELAPSWPGAHLLAAAVAKRLGDKHAAARHSEKALELAPTSKDVLHAAYESAAGRQRRRQLAGRLAFTVPSDAATALVVATHRASPRFAVGAAVLATAGLIGADLAAHGELPGASVNALWVVGPIVAIAVAGLLLARRYSLLSGWEEEIRLVVVSEERLYRWVRRLVVAVLLVLPVLWIPSSITGRHAGAWALTTAYAGALVGLGFRFGAR